MHLLYVDESGSVSDPAQQYFVLVGVSVFERKTHWIEQNLNEIAKQFSLQDPHAIELHGSPMRSGREGWKIFSLADRLTAIKEALKVGIADYHSKGVSLFGVVIRKQAFTGEDPIEYAFEQLSSRFDLFLKRRHNKHNDPQRGTCYLITPPLSSVFKPWPGNSNTVAIPGGKPVIMPKYRYF